MPEKKPIIASNWVDPDDAPALDRAWFEAAEIRHGNAVIRPAKIAGRPKLVQPKQAVSIRLDADVLEHYRAMGPGWQSRINADLRKIAKAE